MTEEEARAETIKLFGEDSFTEFDDAGGVDRYYVGRLPTKPGPYIGFMGFSWREALDIALQFDAQADRIHKAIDSCLSV